MQTPAGFCSEKKKKHLKLRRSCLQQSIKEEVKELLKSNFFKLFRAAKFGVATLT
jgi:hypothetical protein